MYNIQDTQQKNCIADWTFTNSDHAAVVLELSDITPIRNRSNAPKLDPSKLDNEQFKLNFIREYLQMVREEPEGWDAHLTLEFHKCAIRSAYSAVSKESNSK